MAWHFIPAFCLVWLFSFLAVKNIPPVKKTNCQPVKQAILLLGCSCLFIICAWLCHKTCGTIAFYPRLVYTGFFLFAMSAIIHYLKLVKNSTNLIVKPLFGLILFIFLLDNICWFASNIRYNNTGIHFNKAEQGLIKYFAVNPNNGWIINPESNAKMATYLQLYSAGKA